MTHAPTRLLELAPFPTDPVLGCLLTLARRHRRLVDEDILTTGLTLDATGCLAENEIPRAAARAGFAAEIVEHQLDDLDPAGLPALVFLADGDACILTARRADGTCEVLLADTPSPALVPSTTLAARYTGRAMTLRPREHATDDEVTPAARSSARPQPWRPMLPLVLAVLPGDAVALTVAAFLPYFAHHWGSGARTVAAAAAVAVLVEAGLRLLRALLLDRAGRAAERALATKLFRQLLGQPQPTSTGAFAEALRVFEAERGRLARTAVAAVAELPFFVALLAAVAWLGGPLAVVPLAAAPTILAVGLLLHPACERAAGRRVRAEARRQALLVETLSAVDGVRALGAEARLQQVWEERSAAARRSTAAARLLDEVTACLPAAFQGMVLIGVGVWGARLVLDQTMTAAALAVCLLLSGRILAWLGEVAGLLARRRSAMAAVSTLRSLAPPVEKPRAEPRLGRPQLRAVTLREIGFTYPDRAQPALDAVSFRLTAGERLALTGAAGAGKTTLVRLLLGLSKPTTGEVLINDRPLSADAAELRGLIAVVPQEPTLFTGSLRDNLALGQPSADDAAIRRAATLAGIDDVVGGFGLDGAIGERGERLSAGQRQGVALARALLSDAPLLILDEPCGAWDDEALRRLAERLAPDLANRSLLLITPRRPLLALADRVLRLENGKLV